MGKPNHVTVAVPARPSAERLLTTALELYPDANKLEIVHGYVTGSENEGRIIRNHIESVLSNHETGDTEIEIVGDVVGTTDYDEIGRFLVNYADASDTDVLVMGYRESGLIEDFLLGNASEVVLEERELPVTLVP